MTSLGMQLSCTSMYRDNQTQLCRVHTNAITKVEPEDIKKGVLFVFPTMEYYQLTYLQSL